MSAPEIVSEVDVSASHHSAALAEVLVDGVVAQTLDVVTDGSVSYDGSAASRGRFDLTVVGDDLIPTQPDDLLAPFGNEIRLARGIRRPAGDELVRLGIFRIDRASASAGAEGATIRIEGNDRSGRFTDEPFESDGFFAKDTDAVTAILTVLLEVWPTMPYDFAAVSVALPRLVWSEGDDRWAFAQGIATSLGGELYFNDDGVCVLRPIPLAIAGNPVATFAEGEGGVLLGAERDWDRADIFNRWVVTGENTTNDAIVRGEAADLNPASPTYYYGRFGKKTGRWSSSFIATNDQAADAAAGKLARSTGAPDNISIEAIVDPARRPSDVVRIKRAKLGVDEDHVLDSLTIPLSAGASMPAQTRATAVV